MRASQPPVQQGPVHLFSVDVEEYFQVVALQPWVRRDQWDRLPSRVVASVDTILDLLEQAGARGTFFTLGWVAERQPELIRRIAAGGHEIASHGWSHTRLTELSREALRDELLRSREILENVSQTPVLGFRAPSFSILPGMEWAFDLLLETGYRYDSSLFPILRPDYGYPSASPDPAWWPRAGGRLLEIPMATTAWAGLRLPAAGGAYIRQLPYALTARALRECGARGMPGMFYIHPWEIDPGQPRFPVPLVTRMRHYGGLSRTLGRLRRLVAEFRFTSVSEYLARHPIGDSAT
jgi:polysaccharide deacetylase family protein (PEP-CTERM system associated)